MARRKKAKYAPVIDCDDPREARRPPTSNCVTCKSAEWKSDTCRLLGVKLHVEPCSLYKREGT